MGELALSELLSYKEREREFKGQFSIYQHQIQSAAQSVEDPGENDPPLMLQR